MDFSINDDIISFFELICIFSCNGHLDKPLMEHFEYCRVFYILVHEHGLKFGIAWNVIEINLGFDFMLTSRSLMFK